MGSTINPPDQKKLGSSFPFKFDLNLPPPPEDEEETQETDQTDQNHHKDSQSLVVNAADGSALQDNGDKTSMGEEGNEGSLVVGPEEDEDESKRRRRFTALLEVGRIVSGEDGLSEPIEPSELLLMNYGTTGISRQGNASSAAAAEEEMRDAEAAAAAAEEQVGRRRSGRTQVLPNRYRDSVMEPMTSLSSRHNRSSSKK